jgi:hypothetical protein
MAYRRPVVRHSARRLFGRVLAAPALLAAALVVAPLLGAVYLASRWRDFRHLPKGVCPAGFESDFFVWNRTRAVEYPQFGDCVESHDFGRMTVAQQYEQYVERNWAGIRPIPNRFSGRGIFRILFLTFVFFHAAPGVKAESGDQFIYASDGRARMPLQDFFLEAKEHGYWAFKRGSRWIGYCGGKGWFDSEQEHRTKLVESISDGDKRLKILWEVLGTTGARTDLQFDRVSEVYMKLYIAKYCLDIWDNKQ